jgi:hypothetical protein
MGEVTIELDAGFAGAAPSALAGWFWEETGVGGVTTATVAPEAGLTACGDGLFWAGSGVGGVTTATVATEAGLAAGVED